MKTSVLGMSAPSQSPTRSQHAAPDQDLIDALVEALGVEPNNGVARALLAEQYALAGWWKPAPAVPQPAPSRPAPPRPTTPTPLGDVTAAACIDRAFDIRAKADVLLRRAKVLAALEESAGVKGPATQALAELQHILRVTPA